MNKLIDEIPESVLNRLLASYGVADSYTEFSGNVATISQQDRFRAMLSQGVSLESPEQAETLLAQRELAPFLRGLPQVQVCEESSHELRVFAVQAANAEIHWQLQLENGDKRSGHCLPEKLQTVAVHELQGKVFEEKLLAVGELPAGYHELRIQLASGPQNAGMIIVAPGSSFQPDWLQGGNKVWGISAQLYTLKSAGNWGIGDFSDLAELIRHSAAKGADFVLLNPLHALDISDPEHSSPYSPTDRRFLNFLYICPQWCEEFDEDEVAVWLKKHKLESKLAACRDSELVNYSEVFELKLRLFKFLYKKFCRHQLLQSSELSEEFRSFIEQGGDLLREFTEYQAACQVPSLNLHDRSHFFQYLQWQAARQLRRCQQETSALNMRIGLINDVAVGSVSGGFEVLSNTGLFSETARIGAPPDNFSPHGQDWGMPPMCPDALIKTGFRHFIKLLRCNMQGNGALRIDHVMALMRLWWCFDRDSDGVSEIGGAYVYYPVDALFAILRLESRRAECMVIGEDLGVVPPEIRHYLDDSGIVSNLVFYFEKYDGWHFRQVQDFKTHALVMIANHDVPTLKAWWNKSDLTLRRRIGLIADDEKLRQENSNRDAEKQELLNWLSQQGRLPANWSLESIQEPFDTVLTAAIAGACASSASVMVSIPLDDLAELDLPVNIPGTDREYANWRRKIPFESGALLEQNNVGLVLKAIREARDSW